MKRTSNTFYCFSPPVMLATFLIEVGFALYIIWRYKLTTISRLVVLILLSLATFQGAEYMLCGGMGVYGGVWSKLGYSAISLLPPLGLHLAYTIAGKRSLALIISAYATAAIFVFYFTFLTGSVSGYTCYANYVVFQGDYIWGTALYALYYYGWLLTGVWACLRLGSLTKNHLQRYALYWLAAGYSAFIIPTTLANIIDPSTISGIPSIMCGFAVILAFILTLKVTPSAAHEKESNSTKKLA